MTIKTQLENGTFNMLNKEVQKNKISNKNLKFELKEKFCNKCNMITIFKIFKNGKELCTSCFGKKFGLGNKNTHLKTIQSQLKNGTFNMLNSKIHKNQLKQE